MSAEDLQTSAHFRANLGVLNEAALQEFSKWAAVNCIHHVMQEENGSTVLYATRHNSRTAQQHKNALRAVASNRKFKLKTEACFLRLLHKEYEAMVGEASATDVQTDAPLRESVPPMCCRMEILAQLPEGFDAHAGALLSQIASAL